MLEEDLLVFGSHYCNSKLLRAKGGVAKSGMQGEFSFICFLLNGSNCCSGYNENEASEIMTLFDKLALITLPLY